MQVFGLPRHIRAGALASRIAAKSLLKEAALRLDAVRRWHKARAAGLSADAAADALGVSRATLYRWSRRADPLSRRPGRVRRPQWSPALARAVEALRGDNPMWSKRKLAWLIRREGIAVSTSTVGRIGKRYARRLPKGLKPTTPGQIDTVFVNLAPEKAVKHFTAYDPVAKWTVAGVAGRATANLAAVFLDKVIAEMPFAVAGI